MRKIILAKNILAVLLSALGFIGTSLAQANAIQTQEQVPKPAVLTATAPKKSWTDYVTVKGDVRLRLETINDDSKKNTAGEHYTRDRLRIRARSSVYSSRKSA